MSFKRLLLWLLTAFAVFFVIQSPNEAATLVKVSGENAGDWFGAAAKSLSTFVKSLI